MNLTERERRILQLANQGLSDYKIAHILKIDPPTVTKSHKNAQKKLAYAQADIKWATEAGLDLTDSDFGNEVKSYRKVFKNDALE
jgi:DNA-binding NarL/FixJ family response regulator